MSPSSIQNEKPRWITGLLHFGWPVDSKLRNQRSTTKGPNGTTAPTIAARPSLTPIGTRFIAIRQATTNAKKSTPCSVPTMVTAMGIFAKYFKGIATPKSTNVDVPSINPSTRSFLKSLTFISSKRVYSVRQDARSPKSWKERVSRFSAMTLIPIHDLHPHAVPDIAKNPIGE